MNIIAFECFASRFGSNEPIDSDPFQFSVHFSTFTLYLRFVFSLSSSHFIIITLLSPARTHSPHTDTWTFIWRQRPHIAIRSRVHETRIHIFMLWNVYSQPSLVPSLSLAFRAFAYFSSVYHVHTKCILYEFIYVCFCEDMGLPCCHAVLISVLNFHFFFYFSENRSILFCRKHKHSLRIITLLIFVISQRAPHFIFDSVSDACFCHYT